MINWIVPKKLCITLITESDGLDDCEYEFTMSVYSYLENLDEEDP